MIAADAVVYDPVYPEPMRGKKAIMADLDASFSAIPDVHYEILKLLTKDRDAVVEFRITGTRTGSIQGQSEAGNGVLLGMQAAHQGSRA
jgi:predicted ester cyclase